MVSKGVKYFILTLVLVLGAFLLGYYLRPAPTPTQIIQNPTKDQEKKADIVTQEKQHGHATGSIQTGQNSGEVSPGGSNSGTNTPGNDPGLPGPSTGLKNGIYKVPISGELTTVYMNKKTGQPLGEGSSPLTGESIVTVDNGTLAIDNTFDSVKVEAMYTDKPPDYKNEVRLAYNGEFTTTYQRDLFILHFKTFDVSPFVSAILNLGANPLEVGKYSLDNVAIGAAVKF